MTSIDEIEGVGPAYAEKLAKVIHTTQRVQQSLAVV